MQATTMPLLITSYRTTSLYRPRRVARISYGTMSGKEMMRLSTLDVHNLYGALLFPPSIETFMIHQLINQQRMVV